MLKILTSVTLPLENFLAANNYPETDAHEIELVCPIREDQVEVFEEILEIIH